VVEKSAARIGVDVAANIVHATKAGNAANKSGASNTLGYLLQEDDPNRLEHEI